MKKILIGTFLILFQTNVNAMKYNPNLCDQVASTTYGRIIDGIKDDETAIKNRLTFIDERETATPLGTIYGEERCFSECAENAKQYKPMSFFASICRKIYDSGNDQTKAAVHILLKKVLDKYEYWLSIDRDRIERRQKPIKSPQIFPDIGVFSDQ